MKMAQSASENGATVPRRNFSLSAKHTHTHTYVLTRSLLDTTIGCRNFLGPDHGGHLVRLYGRRKSLSGLLRKYGRRHDGAQAFRLALDARHGPGTLVSVFRRTGHCHALGLVVEDLFGHSRHGPLALQELARIVRGTLRRRPGALATVCRQGGRPASHGRGGALFRPASGRHQGATVLESRGVARQVLSLPPGGLLLLFHGQRSPLYGGLFVVGPLGRHSLCRAATR